MRRNIDFVDLARLSMLGLGLATRPSPIIVELLHRMWTLFFPTIENKA